MIKQATIAIGMTMFAAAALAGGHSFGKLDGNGNGQISWSEAKGSGVPHSNFQAADGNGDGALSKHEYQSAVSHWMFFGGDS